MIEESRNTGQKRGEMILKELRKEILLKELRKTIVFHRARIFKLLRSPGIESARLCSLAGRYENPIPTRFLALLD
jgi:hypothetical protein